MNAEKRSLRHNEKASSSRNLLGIIDRSHQLTIIIPKLYVFKLKLNSLNKFLDQNLAIRAGPFSILVQMYARRHEVLVEVNPRDY